VAEVLYRNIT